MTNQKLVELIGSDAAERLMEAVGGGTIYVPISESARKRAIASACLRRGMTPQQIMRLGISRRTIERLRGME